VPIPLDVAAFDADGLLIEVVAMPVCEKSPCPVFAPTQSFHYALEVPSRTLDRLPADARLTP
jgi:uncharacterized membrane protein (UPF0127 family)